MLGVGQRTVKKRMSAFGLSVSGDIKIFPLLERGFSQESLKGDFNWDVKGNFSWARGGCSPEGGTWVFFGWVCAARDSKLTPRSRKNFPQN